MTDGAISPEAQVRVAVPEKVRTTLVPKKNNPNQANVNAEVAAIGKYIQENPEALPAQSVADMLADQDAGLTTGSEVLESNFPDAAKAAEVKKIFDANAEILANHGKVDLTDSKFEHVTKGLDQILDKLGYGHMNDKQKGAFYEAVLQDPDFLREMSLEQLATGKFEIPENQALQQARAKALEADQKFQEFTDERAEVDTKLTQVKKDQADIDAGGPLKADRDTLDAANLDTELSLAQENLRITRAEVDKLTTMKPPGDTTTAKENIKKYTEAIAKHTKDITRRDYLKNLPDQIKQMEANLTKIDQNLVEAGKTKTEAGSAYARETLKANQSQVELMNRVKNVARTGLQRQIDKNMEDVRGVDEARVEQMKAEATTSEEKALSEYIDKRYSRNRNPSIRNRSRIEYNKAQANDDVKTALTAGTNAPEALLKDALTKLGVKDIDQKLKDPQFVSRYGNVMVERAFGIYLRSGGRLTSEEGYYLESQEWGKGLIDRALATSKGVKEMDEKLKAAGIKGGFREFMKTKKGLAAGGLVAILLAVAAGVFTGPVGAGVALGGAAGAGAANYVT